MHFENASPGDAALEALLLALPGLLEDPQPSDHQHAGPDDNGNRQAPASRAK
jgi:hypothetical protein